MTDDEIDRVADITVRGMEGGIRGFMKFWGWQQFARNLMGAYDDAREKRLERMETALILLRNHTSANSHQIEICDAAMRSGEQSMTTEKHTDELWMAAINCPHTIERDFVKLEFDPRQPGHNALNQLVRRLEGALTSRPATPADAEPVASIYVTIDGEREFDDWRCPLPSGRNLLYAAPVPTDRTALVEDYNELLSIVGDILSTGHMNQEDLARLRNHVATKDQP